jgi:hypothetical protein
VRQEGRRNVIRRAILLAALAALATPLPAEACSASWKRGWSPKEIKRRADVREVEGTWRLSELQGQRYTDGDGQEWVIDGRFTGRIETARGWVWETWHEPPDERTTCYVGRYFKPVADAKGRFWITRSKVDGRYRILLWEGEYLPSPGAAPKPD